MAFKNIELSVIAYANGFTLWQYRTEDTIADIKDGYFPKRILDLMANGDIMIINASNTTDILQIKSVTPFVLGNLGE